MAAPWHVWAKGEKHRARVLCRRWGIPSPRERACQRVLGCSGHLAARREGATHQPTWLGVGVWCGSALSSHWPSNHGCVHKGVSSWHRDDKARGARHGPRLAGRGAGEEPTEEETQRPKAMQTRRGRAPQKVIGPCFDGVPLLSDRPAAVALAGGGCGAGGGGTFRWVDPWFVLSDFVTPEGSAPGMAYVA